MNIDTNSAVTETNFEIVDEKMKLKEMIYLEIAARSYARKIEKVA